MRTEQPAEFYDARLGLAGVPLEKSNWRSIYETVVRWLPADRNVSILDVGCGTGRCAQAISRAGYRNYLGFDFSPKRIEVAAQSVPGFEFRVMDAYSPEAREVMARREAFVITEFLEHVNRDLEVIEAIPPGSAVVFSVPSFDSAGHVRTFADMSAVRARYGGLLRIERERTIRPPFSWRHPVKWLRGNRWFVIAATRKS